MTRETKKIITPIDKHEVVVNTWITGKERRDLQRPFIASMSVSVKGGQPEVEAKETASVIEIVENLTIETVVISVNGKTDDILNEVLNMKNEDFIFVLKEIQKVTSEENFTKPE